MRFSSFNRPVRSCLRLTVFVMCVLAAVIAVVLSPTKRSWAAAGAPVLLTQASSTRAIALDSVTRLAEPFQLQSPVSFGSDSRTRVMLFATNLTLAAGETSAAVTAEAEDVTHAHYR